MKKLLLILLPSCLTLTAFAQSHVNLSKAFKPPVHRNYSPVGLSSSPFGDTLNDVFEYSLSPVLYILDQTPPNDSGYVCGTNSYGILSQLQQYTLPTGGMLSSVLFGFGKATGTGNFRVRVWSDSSGIPGHIVQDILVPISQIDTVASHLHPFAYPNMAYWNCAVNLTTPLSYAPGESFWTGVSFIYAPGDTLGLFSTNAVGSTVPSFINKVYEELPGGLYDSFYTDWGVDIAEAIFPVIEYPVTKITGNVYNDLNNNNIKDAGDTGIANIKVKAGNFVGFTDIMGNYSIYADTGTYYVTPAKKYCTTSPDSMNVSVPTSASISNNNDFAVHYIPNIRDVEVSIVAGTFRPGFSGDYFLSISNNGTQADSGTVDLVLDDSLQYYWAFPAPTTISGQTISLAYPAIQPGESTVLYVSSIVASGVGINYSLMSSAIVNPLLNDSDLVNNYDTIVHITKGAYDPNEKTVSPNGNISPAFVSGNNYLYYTIQFQNTGTDTAFNIQVVDTLSANLDVSSLEVLNASKPWTTQIQNFNTVTFSFSNILLPDSGTNEPKSHGFINYRIRPKNGLANGTQIKNTAYIYFDFNPAVATNSTINTVSPTSSIPAFINPAYKELKVFPNPATSELNLVFSQTGNYSIRFIDLLGKTKMTTLIKNNKMVNLDLSGLPAGCYIIEAEGVGSVYKSKLVKY